MSVINDMLRDLDARQAPERSGISGESHSLVQTSVKAKWHLPLLIVLVFVLLVGAFWLGASSEGSKNDEGDYLPPSSESFAENQITEGNGDVNLGGGAEGASSTVSDSNTQVNATASPAKRAESSASSDKPNVPVGPSSTAVAKTTAPKPVETEAGSVSSSESLSSKAEPSQPRESRRVSNPVVESTGAVKQRSERPSHVDDADTIPASAKVEANDLDQSRSQVRLTPTAQDQQVASQNQKLLNKGQVAFALKQLYAFIADFEQDSYSRTVLATYLLQAQRFAEAGDVLVPVGQEELPALRLLKARWLSQTYGQTRALMWLESNPPEVAEHAEYFSLQANYYQQVGKFERSVDTYVKLLEFDAEKADWWLGLGVGYDRLKRYDDAAFAYRQAVAMPNLKPSLVAFANDRLKQLTR